MGQISVEPGMSAGGHRRFSLEFRVEFLRAWDGCVERGAKTRLLREYGLDRNTVYAWVRARDNGELEQSQQRVASRSDVGQMRAELARLRAENGPLRPKRQPRSWEKRSSSWRGSRRAPNRIRRSRRR